LELDPRQLRDALDQAGDVLAELGADVVDRGLRVLDDVVQERSRDRLLVEVQLGADLRGAEGVQDEVLARPPELALVRLRRKPERPREQLPVDRRVVRCDLLDELVDEVLMRLVSLENRHRSSVLRGLGYQSSLDCGTQEEEETFRYRTHDGRDLDST